MGRRIKLQLIRPRGGHINREPNASPVGGNICIAGQRGGARCGRGAIGPAVTILTVKKPVNKRGRTDRGKTGEASSSGHRFARIRMLSVPCAPV